MLVMNAILPNLNSLMKPKKILLPKLICLIITLIFANCQQQQKETNQTTESDTSTESATSASPVDNTLTAGEKEQGWKLLFDGQTTAGWRNFKSTGIGPAWKVEDGTLTLVTGGDEKGGDIITDQTYENFELSLEWKIAEGGNSGIIYHVLEEEQYDRVWQTGPEMQILDDDGHPDGKIVKHRAGDLYDLIECEVVTVNPPGEWNKIRLISDNGRVEHWQNGRKVVEFNMDDPSWQTLIAGSKFKDMPGFEKTKKGYISLQDHGDRVWFKNIKIRQL